MLYMPGRKTLGNQRRILDNDADIFCITESWLRPSGNEVKECGEKRRSCTAGLQDSFPVPPAEAALPSLCVTLCTSQTTTTDFPV